MKQILKKQFERIYDQTLRGDIKWTIKNEHSFVGTSNNKEIEISFIDPLSIRSHFILYINDSFGNRKCISFGCLSEEFSTLTKICKLIHANDKFFIDKTSAWTSLEKFLAL